MVVDMVWNILSVSPRVITLALFASYEVHWFWYIGGTHVVVMTGVSYFVNRDNERRYVSLSTLIGFGCLFNFCSLAQQEIRFRVYLLYWLIMFTENIVMISLWYHWSSYFDLWYHDIVLVFVIVMHLLSLVVECLHAYVYNGRKKVRDICGWFFHPGFENRDDKVNTGLSQSKI